MLQMIAMVSMLIDHIGVVFYPDDAIWRAVGRLAFPLYAYGIVQGMKYTRNMMKYQERLILLAILSQMPFMMATGEFKLNVIFTFLICLYVVRLLEKKTIKHYMIMLPIMAATQFFADYGMYAIALVMIYKHFKGSSRFVAHALLEVAAYILLGWKIQFISLLATLIIINKDKLKKININKYLYRSFYPAHLLLLWIIHDWGKLF